MDADAARELEAIAGRLAAGPGVHRPSAFSVLLAASLPPLEGLRAIDAGCGAGLVAIAMLRRGAARVTAQDLDPAALRDTAANVEAELGAEAARRLALRRLSWVDLGDLDGDLLAVNPPQRPAAILDAVPAAERHLHEGGGADGLDALRVVLAHAATPTVLATASSLAPGDPAAAGGALGWHADVLAEATLRHAEPWRALCADLLAPVRVWRFVRPGLAGSRE